MVALFIFVSIAVVAVYRLPTSPQTFQVSELENVAVDALKVRAARVPAAGDDCNESPCHFANDLDRLFSLALGYVGPTVAGSGEDPDASELRNFLDQALPPGANYRITLGNGVEQRVIAPLDAVPPAASVVVARTLITPNWSVHTGNETRGAWMRVGDLTGLPNGVASIRDPLNRDRDMHGTTWVSLFTGAGARVPSQATFGTYRVCITVASPCGYFTIVPNGTAGAGSQVQVEDLPRAAPLRSWDSPNGPRLGESLWHAAATSVLYIRANGAPPDVVSIGDIRLSRVSPCRGVHACGPGTIVRAGDADLTTALLPYTHPLWAPTDPIEKGTALYGFAGGGPVPAGAYRFSRVGHYNLGSVVAEGQYDYGIDAPYQVPLNDAHIQYLDLDLNEAYTEGEPLYLNVNALGLTTDLEALDYYLVGVGRAAHRYAYDVKLEVWYGV
jgi:hypothetical protein